MDRQLLHDGLRDGFSDGAGGVAADDQTPPEEMDPGAVSPRQRLALEAFCKGGTIGDAAKAANVTRQTLHRWRAKYPHFDLAMSSWSSACLSMAESQLTELASRAVGALSDAIDKGDANTARAVLRSLGVLRTYQPGKAPGASRESRHAGIPLPQDSGAPASRDRAAAGKVTDAPREQANTRSGEREKEMVATPLVGAPPAAAARDEARPAAANVLGVAAKPEVTETRPTDCQPARVLRHQDVTSEWAKEQKPAILAGKAGSVIKMACDSALQDVTEFYQMLPNATWRDALPPGIALAV